MSLDRGTDNVPSAFQCPVINVKQNVRELCSMMH